eukprot:COSAG01_NODE_5850_length_3994_cov_5.826958_8_plen_73_part_00
MRHVRTSGASEFHLNQRCHVVKDVIRMKPCNQPPFLCRTFRKRCTARRGALIQDAERVAEVAPTANKGLHTM